MVKIKTIKEDLMRMEEICIDAALHEFKQDPGKNFESEEIQRKKLQAEIRGTIEHLSERLGKGFTLLRDVASEHSESLPSLAAHMNELNKIHTHSLPILQAWDVQNTAHEIPSIKDIAQLSSTALESFFEAAQFLMNEKRFSDAADVLFYLCNLSPNEVNYLLALGSAEFHAGEFLKASLAFDFAELLDPQNPFPYLYGAHCRERLGQYDEALQLANLSLWLIEEEPGLEELKSDATRLVATLNEKIIPRSLEKSKFGYKSTN